jgi:hypothetical protein
LPKGEMKIEHLGFNRQATAQGGDSFSVFTEVFMSQSPKKAGAGMVGLQC